MPSLRLDFAHGAAIVVSIATAALLGRLIHAALKARPRYPLGLDHHRRRVEWREYSSPHDMVGRMLGPTLPYDVEQPWIAPVGQPFSNHTLYFHRTGVLPRRLAADLLSDLGLKREAADWDQAVTWLDEVRRRQGTRRRALHGLPVGAFATLHTRWRARIVPPGPRLLPTVAAATGGLVAVYGTVRFFLAAREFGDVHVWQGYPFLFPMGIGLLLVACASAAGYPVRARWYGVIAVLGCMALYSAPAPAAMGSPWEVRPEGTLLGSLGMCLVLGLAGSLHARLRAIDLTAQE
ncbi:hypothetical protein ACFXGT_20450 [Streptomyces sp. NPDC059352]|uniref:hypothetical protein n=1 Tax=Streptomyces sp. NPDC059352 TaxID=3346810 RepID=UPI0036C9B332